MTRVLRAEWLKLKHYRAFWVLTVLYPVCLGLIVVLSLWGQTKAQSMATSAAQSGLNSNLPLGFPQVWHNLAYIASWLYFIPALLIILNVSNEFTFRTHRQNILEGWSRLQFLAAKLLVALSLSLYCTILTFLFSLGAGLVSGTTLSLEGLSYVALFFLQTSFYTVFALVVGFLVRRAALSVGAFLIYSAVLENLLSFFLNLRFKGVGNYLPLNAASGILPLPYYEEHAPQVAKNFFAQPTQTALLIATSVYMLLFIGLMAWRFSREDL